MDGIVKTTVNAILGITGLSKIIAEFNKEPWMGVVFALTVALSLLWMFRGKVAWLGLREPGKIAATFGKFPGGIAVAFIFVTVGITLAFGLVMLLVNAGADSVIAGVREVRWIGWLLAWILTFLKKHLLRIVVYIGIGVFVLKSLHSVFSQIWGAFTGAAKDYADPKAPHGVKMLYQICGSLVMAILLCNPVWNRDLWFAPAIASSLFGIYAFFASTKPGQQMVRQGRMKVLHQADPVTGDGPCVNWGYKIHKGQKVAVSCGHIIPQSARHCPNPLCPAKNPYWIHECEGCGWKGEDGRGIQREKVDQWQKCPQCGHNHPPRNKRLGFQPPGGMSTPPSAAPTATMAPVTLVMPDMPLEVACTKCGKPYDMGHGYKGCPNCGQPFGIQSRVVKQPPTPSERYAEKRARTRKPWKRKFSA